MPGRVSNSYSYSYNEAVELLVVRKGESADGRAVASLENSEFGW